MDFSQWNIKLTTEEVLFAAQIFNSVYTNQAPIPELFGVEPPNDGESYLQLSNIPINRANIALLDAFKEEPEKGSALGFRLMTMVKFITDPRASKWIRQEDGHEMIHHNIFEALAKFKITGDEQKTKDNFFEELYKLGEPNYDEKA